MKNPGLDEYDLSKYNGLRNKNFFELDSALKRVLKREFSSISEEEKIAIFNHISGYGSLVGGILNTLTEKCHKEGKYGEVQKYNATGERIDEIIYSQEQLESRKYSYDYGVVNLDFHKAWKFPFRIVHRYALAYLMNLNGEGGVSCPLAMTDGLILALKNLGTEDQKKRYLELIASENSSSHFFAGQYVTERVGGSNVAANRTIARKSENGKWILNGEKWFCSNPGDLWVTTARIDGSSTIGLFLVPRIKSDGKLNGHHILRKKDIIGSKGKVTVEIIYEDLEAEELGRPSHGLSNLIKYIITISRIHVGIGACGNSRRAVMEALEYAKYRTAYGKNLKNFFIYERTLCELVVIQTALLFSNFKSIKFYELNRPSFKALVPLMKYISSSTATKISHASILCLGGNGIINDFSPLPRILNDSIINESWEGTHLLLTEHVVKALEKKRIREDFFSILEITKNEITEFPTEVRELFQEKYWELKELLDLKSDLKDAYRLKISDLVYELFSISNLCEEVMEDKKK